MTTPADDWRAWCSFLDYFRQWARPDFSHNCCFADSWWTLSETRNWANSTSPCSSWAWVTHCSCSVRLWWTRCCFLRRRWCLWWGVRCFLCWRLLSGREWSVDWVGPSRRSRFCSSRFCFSWSQLENKFKIA